MINDFYSHWLASKKEKIKIINKQFLQVIGFQVVAEEDYLHTEIPHMLNMMYRRIDEVFNKVDSKLMDIYVKKDTKLLTHLICVEVSELWNVPEGMVGAKFPSQKYISYKHTGSFYEIRESFDGMYKWAEENEYKPEFFKIDYGYFEKEKEPIEHMLYLAVKD